MGSNGEAVSLKEDEKLELVKNVRKTSKPRSTIIAGLGLPSKLLHLQKKFLYEC